MSFGKASRATPALSMGYGTNYPPELQKKIGPGPGGHLPAADPNRHLAPSFSIRPRYKAAGKTAYRSPGPANYDLPSALMNGTKGAEATGGYIGNEKRFTGGFQVGADAELIMHARSQFELSDFDALSHISEMDSSSVVSVESLGGSAGSVADGSLALSTRSLRSAGQSSIYDTRIGMGKQALSQFVSPPGGGFARSLRPSPGLQTLSGEVGSSFPSVVEKQPLSRYPSAKTMVFGTSQRPGPADGLVRRKAPGPGTYEGQGGFGAQPSSRTRTAPTAKFGTGRRLNLTDPKQTL